MKSTQLLRIINTWTERETENTNHFKEKKITKYTQHVGVKKNTINSEALWNPDTMESVELINALIWGP